MASQGGEREPTLTTEYPSSSGTSTANESELTQPYGRSQQDSLDAAFRSMILKIAKQLNVSDREAISFLYSEELGPGGESMSGLGMLDRLVKAGVFHARKITVLMDLLKECDRHDLVNRYVMPYHATVHASEPIQEDHGGTPARKKPRLDDSIEGFDVSDVDRECKHASVHGVIVDVSPLHPTRKNPAWKYFSADVTDGKETLRFLCFNPTMRRAIEKMKKTKKPCTITNCTIKQSTYPPTAGDFEVHCTSKTKVVANPEKKFDISDDLVYTSSLIVEQLSDLKDIIKGQSVTVCGKITTVMESSKLQQSSSGAMLTKADCVLADRSMSVRLKIWEDNIGEIHEGKSYRFIKVKMRQYQGQHFLTTTEDSTFTEIDDIGEISNDKTLQSTHREIQGQIAVVAFIDKYKSCPSLACNAKVDPHSEMCGKCDGLVNISLCNEQVCAKLTLHDESKQTHEVIAFTEVLSQITGSQTLSSLPELEIKQLVRHAAPALFNVNDRNVITKVKRKE